jgi:hypothetical protein
MALQCEQGVIPSVGEDIVASPRGMGGGLISGVAVGRAYSIDKRKTTLSTFRVQTRIDSMDNEYLLLDHE